MHMTSAVRSIFRALLDSPDPTYTDALAERTANTWAPADRVLNRLGEKGWVTSALEPGELAAAQNRGVRRYWTTTNFGRTEGVAHLADWYTLHPTQLAIDTAERTQSLEAPAAARSLQLDL